MLKFTKSIWEECVMRLLLTKEQMKKADDYTIETIGIPSMVLMERAALAVIDVMKREQLDLSNSLILCGTGNNGGDGFAVARILYQSGHDVTVAFIGDSTKRSVECERQMSICENLGLDIVECLTKDMEEDDKRSTKIKGATLFNHNYTVVIDCIFGIGLSYRLSEEYIQVIKRVNSVNSTKVAIDIPSGICGDSGKVLGEAIKADLTIGIQCEKRGTILFPGKDYAGKVVPVDIGIVTTYKDGEQSGQTMFEDEELCYAYERSDVKGNMPQRWENSHKGTYGKVLVIAGSVGMSGAAYLAARAAYGVGVGLVQVYTPEENRAVLQTLLPEAIVTTYRSVDENCPLKEEVLKTQLSQLEKLLEGANVVCIGPGLGTGTSAQEILKYTLRNGKVPMVIDADGINLLKGHENLLIEAKQPCIITPHIKEMATFMDVTIPEIQEDLPKSLREFTKKYPSICVLKDARTLVGKRQLPFFINTSGNNAMAKGGSGDVLAGVIAGLMAYESSFTPYEAATFGVYLHGLGGDRARDRLGSYSVLARDVITGIQEVLREEGIGK